MQRRHDLQLLIENGQHLDILLRMHQLPEILLVLLKGGVRNQFVVEYSKADLRDLRLHRQVFVISGCLYHEVSVCLLIRKLQGLDQFLQVEVCFDEEIAHAKE